MTTNSKNDITIEMLLAKLYLPFFSQDIVIHYRPADGCECKQFYDGCSDMLLNLDNKNIYPHLWLFDILHNTQETHFSLHGAYRSVNRTRMHGDILFISQVTSCL